MDLELSISDPKISSALSAEQNYGTAVNSERTFAWVHGGHPWEDYNAY